MLGIPRNQQAYQPLGNLWIRFKSHEGAGEYRRELDLQNGIVRVSYQVGDARFKREVFASCPDQVIVMRLACDRPRRLLFDVTMDSPHPSVTEPGANGLLRMSGQVAGQKRDGLLGPWAGKGLKFEARVQVIADGDSVQRGDKCLQARGADAATLVYTAATGYKNYRDISGDPEAICEKVLSAAAAKSYEELRSAHIADHRSLFERVEIDLGGKEAAQRPTDERLRAVKAGGDDPHLAAQSFQFGRYLLIASSRPGTQPANLQGIWNEKTRPAWGSKWTLNINAEMNYWPAEVCNLAECHEPLLRLVEELRKPGRKTAKVHYNCRGFVVHHNADIWRGTAPVDGAKWGIWQMGGAWLCHHLWEHYAFGGNREFLKRAYPTMKEAAEFFVDFLVPDEDGYLVTCPTISFEQPFVLPDGRRRRLCAAPTMNRQILNDLFSNCIEAAEILGIDRDFAEKLKEVKSRLAPMRVSAKRGLQEWKEDWEPAVGTGQAGYLWGLCPGDQITVRDTPELAEGALRSLAYRGLDENRERLGSWISGTLVNYYARLEDSRAYLILQRHLRQHVASSLLSFFSNEDVFQIDGNLGVTAGIAEMLLQSHAGEINLLPALPKAWASGYVKGLRARGGFEVDIYWEDGKLTRAAIRSLLGNDCKLRYGDKVAELKTKVGKDYKLNGELERR
jgi:alpha-L-fucosidase 2